MCIPRERLISGLTPRSVRVVLVTSLQIVAVTVLACARTCLAQEQLPTFTVNVTRELDLGDTLAWTPKWSPDGQWIAFSLPKSEGIALVKPDGSGLRILTTEPRSGYRFAWSPDGTKIAYRALRAEAGPRRYVIRTIDLATNEFEESDVIPDALPPQWQAGPAGARWVSHDGKKRIDGTWKPSRNVQGGAATSAPLVLAQDRQLWMESADGTIRQPLTDVPGIRPTWDRAGRRVLVDATDRIQLASADAGEPARQLCVGQHPAWSPDGEWIVFQITRDHSHAPGDDRQHAPDTLPHLHNDKTNHQIVDSELWVIHRDGTRRHQLTSTPEVLESDPDWSADGKSIVCRDERTGRLRILEVSRQ